MPTQIELVKTLSADSDNWHEKYPWYSLGQLVNVADKKQHDGFQAATQKAAIFFNDIQRMHWLLHEQAFNKNKILSELNVPISTEGMQLTPQPFPKREHVSPINAPTHLIAVAAVEESDALTSAPSLISNESVIDDDVIIHEEETLSENDVKATIEDKTQKNEVEEQAEPIKIYIQQPEIVNETTEVVEPVIENKQLAEKEIKPIVEETKEKTNTIATENPKNENIATADNLNSIAKAQDNIKAALSGGESMDLTFEPYHTIDYFASQGIKVDTKMDDRLGKQLKSFTSWLKTMKRLPATEENASEAQIIPLNDKSLENTNVVTEAMAAVLVKQGKKDLAVEIFKKLSLLHPEKSRYFAAQIEQIKN